MGWFRRSPDVSVTVTPAIGSPRQMVTATASTTEPVTGVESATMNWGYTNYYRYHWAGQADSVATERNDKLLNVGEVGTNYGGDHETDDWVSVSVLELPVSSGEFVGGSTQFRIPSWAPGSSQEIAEWVCRLTIKREAGDIEESDSFTVAVGPHDSRNDPTPLERYDGPAETEVDIVLPETVFAAGGVIRGEIILTPTRDLPDGDLRVSCQRHRQSHPITRRPAATAPIDGPTVRLDSRIPLRAKTPVAIPFELQLPTDAAPTATAVHSSMDWSVAAQLFYAGPSGPLSERVRRGIIVVS